MRSPPSSSSSSSGMNTPKLGDKCLICYQSAHGNHFGVDSCRACAAFFRRVFVTHKQQFKCREGDNKCTPDSYGRWQCKRCRTDKCFALGMKPDNIQRDRDLFICSEKFQFTKKRKAVGSIPSSIERTVGVQIAKSYSLGDGLNMEYITFFDLSPIISDAEYILKKTPKMDSSMKKMSSLEQLAFGLREVRKSQIWDGLPEMKSIGKNETWNQWVEAMRRAAKWIMHFREFRELEQGDKMAILTCMWHLFTRLERIAMTAEMRRRRLCDEQEFVFGTDLRINYENLKLDSAWFADVPEEQVRYFIGPLQVWFCETLIAALMELQPSDVELSFMLCNLCFLLTGNKLGGRIQEITERLQEILANDLHEYYLERDRHSRYSHRLSKMLSLNREFQSGLARRKQRIFLADTLNVFKVKLSHPEMFQFSC